MKLTVFTPDATSTAERDYPLPTFEGKKGLRTLKDLMVAYAANRRQGTAKTKTRAEVNRTGKKLFRQKGTGNARHGDRGAPIYVGGGVAHGPKVRDWSHSFNKKARRLAFARALFDKASEGGLCLIERFDSTEPKTKTAAEIFSRIDAGAKTLLICDQAFTDNAVLSTRNIERISMTEADSLNAWDLVRYEKVVLTERALEAVLSRINGVKGTTTNSTTESSTPTPETLSTEA